MRVAAMRRAIQDLYEHLALDPYLYWLDSPLFRRVVAGGYAQTFVFGAWFLAVFAWLSLGRPELPPLATRFGPAGLGVAMVAAGFIGAMRAKRPPATNRLERWLVVTMCLLMYPIAAGILIAGLLDAAVG